MGLYRVYTVGAGGRFTGRHDIECVNDDAALYHARRFVDGHDVEVWQGARFVALVEREESITAASPEGKTAVQ